jgi:CRISPR-associated endoribonuclease Cas6
MQFKLTLSGTKGQYIPINYQYPLSACIYKIIERADAAYSLFLHDRGHRVGEIFLLNEIKNAPQIGEALNVFTTE